MAYRLRSVLCSSIVFALNVLEGSALLNFTTYKLSIANASNSGLAHPTGNFPTNSTFSIASSGGITSATGAFFSPVSAPPQSAAPATTAKPQSSQPNLIPSPQPPAPPQKPASPEPFRSTTPAPGPGPTISPTLTVNNPQSNSKQAHEAPTDPAITAVPTLETALAIVQESTDGLIPPSLLQPTPQPRSSVAKQAPATTRSENAEVSKGSFQPNTANDIKNSRSSPGQGQPTSPPTPNHPAGQSPVYRLSASDNTFLITPLPSSQYAISSQTLTVGGSVTVNSIAISLPIPGSSIVVGSSTVAFAPALPSPSLPLASVLQVSEGSPGSRSGVVTVANTPVPYENSGSALIIDGSRTLTPGGTATINGVPVFLPTLGSSIVVGSSTVPLELSPSSTSATITKAPLVIEGQTLTPGGAITVSNTLVSLPTSGSALIIDGSRTLTPGGTATVNGVPVFLPTLGSSIVVGSSTVPFELSPSPTSATITKAPLVIEGQTLTPGGAITVSNTLVSLPASGSALIVGGSSTIPIDAVQTLSVGSQALVISQAGPSSGFFIKGSTVAPGSQAVVDGITISVPTQGTDVVINGSKTTALGDVILSALGISPSTTTPVGVAVGAPTGGSNATVAPLNFTGGSPSSIPSGEKWKRWWLEVVLGVGCVYVSGST